MCAKTPSAEGVFLCPLSCMSARRARSHPSVTTTHWGVFRVPRFSLLKSICIQNNLDLIKGVGVAKIYVNGNFL